MSGILTGYGIHINQLTEADVAEHKIDLKGFNISNCIAVHGEDLARCLALVVGIDTRPELLWSDIDGNGTTVPKYQESVAIAVGLLVQVIHPYLTYLV